jgi:hypothetical protein
MPIQKTTAHSKNNQSPQLGLLRLLDQFSQGERRILTVLGVRANKKALKRQKMKQKSLT